MNDPTEHALAHAASLSALIAVLLGVFTPLAALIASLIAACWYFIQIWESETVQGWRGTKALLRWWRRGKDEKTD